MRLIKEAVNSNGDGLAQCGNASTEAGSAWILASSFHLLCTPAAKTSLLKQDPAKYEKSRISYKGPGMRNSFLHQLMVCATAALQAGDRKILSLRLLSCV